MKKIKTLLCTLTSVLLVASVSFTGCKKEDKTAELVDLRLNEVVHSIFYAPQYVALEKGFFEEEGLKITLDVGQGADKSMTALLSGSAEVALLGTEAGFYVYNEGGKDVKPFAQLTQRAGNFLVSREEDKNFTWDKLKGKSVIGGRKGGMPQLVLEYAIKQSGLEEGVDLEIINNIAFTSTSSAFVANVGDYTAEFEPVATTLEDGGNGYIVASLGEATGYIPYTVYMATGKYIEENPEIIQKFTNAIYKGQKWVETHSSKEIAEACLPYFEESNIEMLSRIIDRYKTQNTWKSTPDFDKDGFELIQDIMESGGELEKRVPFDGFILTEFAEKAIETVK